MNKFGEAAIKAVKYYQTVKNPIEAWERATKIIFGESTSRNKGCPKSTFLGLCENGLVKGVKRGIYTDSFLNKSYGLKAINILKKKSDNSIKSIDLWKMIQKNGEIRHNSQMDVVLALWNAKLIK